MVTEENIIIKIANLNDLEGIVKLQAEKSEIKRRNIIRRIRCNSN